MGPWCRRFRCWLFSSSWLVILPKREVGHWVLGLIALGVVLSYFMASLQAALACAAAFLISELLDWAVYVYQTSVVGAYPLFQCAGYPRRQFCVPVYARAFLHRRATKQ